MEFLLKRSFSLKYCRNLFTSKILNSSLSELRKKTGYPLASCKSALAKFNNDIELASKWLDEQAQKEGWTKAEKLKDRKTTQGSLGFYKEKNSAILIELNCETDFVAKNEKFEKILASITKSVFTNLRTDKQKEIFYKNDLMKVKSAENPARTVGDDLVLAIGNLGENLILRRAALLNVPLGQSLGWYLHGADIHQGIDGCKFAKYAALVNFKLKDTSKFEPHDIGRQLAQHVVGMKPTSIGELLPKQTESTVTNEKPKIDENETRFLYQEFLMKPDTRVIDFLNEHDVEIIDFLRVECGEKIDNEPQ